MSAVHLSVTSNASSVTHNVHFSDGITIGNLKERLEIITGCDVNKMTLKLLDDTKQLICEPSDPEKTLKDYGFSSGCILEVHDPSYRDGELDAVINAEVDDERFTITDDDYEQRENTVLAFKKRNKLGQFSDAYQASLANKEAEEARRLEEQKLAAEKITVNSRCQVTVVDQPTRRGTVRFVGQTKFKPGYWVGVEYDEPVGKNDGQIADHRYFQCKPKYGAFVRPVSVETGDFPEFGLDELDEI